MDAALGLIDAELSADDHAALDAHLKTCASCRNRAEALWRQDRVLVELAAEAGLADALAARIGAQLRSAAGPQPQPAQRHSTARRPIARRLGTMIVTAAVVLIALGVWALRGPLGLIPDAGPGRAAEPFARIESVSGRVLLVAAGETPLAAGRAIADGAVLQTVGEESFAAIKLADGTRLELGADTRVTLDDDGPDRAGKRIVLSEGFLTADVAKQPAGRPMTVSTPQAELVVLGTRFQLSGGAELTYIETSEGSVRVTRKSDGRSILVDGGFEAAVGQGADPTARPSPPASLKQRLKLDGFFASALSHDGCTLAASRFMGGEIQWWDLAEAKLVHTQPAQRRRVHAMAFSPDDTTLASGGVEGLVKLWKRDAAEPAQSFPADGPWISDVAALVDGWGVLSGSEGSEERTLSLRSTAGQVPRPPITFTAQRWTFAADGSRLAFYDKRTKALAVRDVVGGSQSAFPTPVGNNVFSLAFAPDGKQLAVDGSSGLIVVCDAATGAIVRKIERRGGRIFGMTFSPDGRRLATGHQDGTIRIWNLADGTQQAMSAGGPVHNRAVAFTPDGRNLLAREIRLATDGTPRDGAVTVWVIP